VVVTESSTRAGVSVDAEAQAGGAGLLSEDAFHALYRATARPLWGYLYRVVGDASLAEDLVQEAFLRILRAPVGGLEGEELRAYLFRVASNLTVDHWRRQSREARTLEQAHQDAPAETAPVVPNIDFARTFQQLAPRERALLWLAYVEGSPHTDIAAALDVKPASVKVLLFRARRRLAALFGTGRGTRS
jgi:RNA polymerase sigma-70 factor, ECF subfamily